MPLCTYLRLVYGNRRISQLVSAAAREVTGDMKGYAMRQKIRDLARRGRAIYRPEVRVPRGPIAATVVAVGLMIAMSSSAMTSTMASAAGRPAYMDAKLSTQARVNDLLGRMTLPEKIGQA
jgi:hypothetical protein